MGGVYCMSGHMDGRSSRVSPAMCHGMDVRVHVCGRWEQRWCCEESLSQKQLAGSGGCMISEFIQQMCQY